MSELSPQARAALRALGSVEPSTADERRVREGLERAVGLALPAAAVIGATAVGSTSAAAATGSTSAASATGASVSAAGLTALGTGAKVMLFVAAVGIGSVVTAGVKAVVPPSQPVRVAAAQPPAAARPVATIAPVVVQEPVTPQPSSPERAVVAVAPAPVMPVSGSPKLPKASKRAEPEPELSADEPVVTPSAPVVAEPPPPSTPALPAAPPTPQSATTEEGFELVVEAHFPDCIPATEIRTAQAARKLLVEQRPEHALFLIGAYQKHCPSGQWSDEAWRVRLSSLCTLGRSTEASSLFEWFATEYPHRRFAIESELRSTCEPSVLGKD